MNPFNSFAPRLYPTWNTVARFATAAHSHIFFPHSFHGISSTPAHLPALTSACTS